MPPTLRWAGGSAQRHQDCVAVAHVGEHGIPLNENPSLPDSAKEVPQGGEREALLHQSIGHRLAVLPQEPHRAIGSVAVASANGLVVEGAVLPALRMGHLGCLNADHDQC